MESETPVRGVAVTLVPAAAAAVDAVDGSAPPSLNVRFTRRCRAAVDPGLVGTGPASVCTK